jgi:hypothetical protein
MHMPLSIRQTKMTSNRSSKTNVAAARSDVIANGTIQHAMSNECSNVSLGHIHQVRELVSLDCVNVPHEPTC